MVKIDRSPCTLYRSISACGFKQLSCTQTISSDGCFESLLGPVKCNMVQKFTHEIYAHMQSSVKVVDVFFTLLVSYFHSTKKPYRFRCKIVIKALSPVLCRMHADSSSSSNFILLYVHEKQVSFVEQISAEYICWNLFVASIKCRKILLFSCKQQSF